MDTLNSNDHQHIIGKYFRVPDTIEKTIKHYKYNNENELVFRGINLGLVEIILRDRVKNNIITKDGRYIFLDIYTYHKFHDSEENCDING